MCILYIHTLINICSYIRAYVHAVDPHKTRTHRERERERETEKEREREGNAQCMQGWKVSSLGFVALQCLSCSRQNHQNPKCAASSSFQDATSSTVPLLLTLELLVEEIVQPRLGCTSELEARTVLCRPNSQPHVTEAGTPLLLKRSPRDCQTPSTCVDAILSRAVLKMAWPS